MNTTHHENGHFDPQSYSAVLSRLETQMKAIDEKLSLVLVNQEKNAQRITALENWRGKLIGIGAIVGAVAGYLVPKVAEHIFKP